MRGPLPSFRPEFPSTFLEQAEKLARHRTMAYQLRQRAILVLLLHQQPRVSNSEAAEGVQLHPRSVQRWRRRWATGDFSLADEPGRGRKAGFSPPDHALVKGVACELVAETNHPLSRPSLADITARARPALGTPISRRTVGRMLATDAIKPWQYK
jgi:transposase